MPVILIYGLTSFQVTDGDAQRVLTAKEINALRGRLEELPSKIPQLKLKDYETTAHIIQDAPGGGNVDGYISVFVGGLLAKKKRTKKVKDRLARKIVKAVSTGAHAQPEMIECFVGDFDAKKHGFAARNF